MSQRFHRRTHLGALIILSPLRPYRSLVQSSEFMVARMIHNPLCYASNFFVQNMTALWLEPSISFEPLPGISQIDKHSRYDGLGSFVICNKER